MRHREPTRPNGRLTAGPRGLGAVLGVLMIASCGSPSASLTPVASPSTVQPSDSATSSPSGPPTALLDDVTAWEVSVETFTAPDWPALLGDAVWVLLPDGEPAVLRLDAATGEEQARVPLPGGSCEMLAAGFESLWACTPEGMVRIDPATNAVSASVAFQTPQQFGRPAVGDDAIWALSGDIVATNVVRIDPGTNTATTTYPLGHAAAQITFGLGYLWATATADGLLLRIDPTNGEVSTAASDLIDPFIVTTGAGRVWVGLQGRAVNEDPDSSVPDLFRFDPATGIGDFEDYGLHPESVNDIAVNDDSAWIQTPDPTLMRLDPETGAIESIVTSDRGSGAIALASDALWMTLWRAEDVVRIDL